MENGKGDSHREEIIVLGLFYFPAFCYEIVSPMAHADYPHQWYMFIYVIPQALMMAFALKLCLEKVNQTAARTFIIVAASGMIVFLTNGAFKEVQKSHAFVKEKFDYWSYENTKLFYKTVMNRLGLTPEELTQRVYIEDATKPPVSQILFDRINSKMSNTHPKNPLLCFYFLDGKSIHKKGDFLSYRENSFLNDRTIQFKNSFFISFARYGILKKYKVISYVPLKKQSCYTNRYNPFPVNLKTWNLLTLGRKLDIHQDLDVIVESIHENFDSQSRLKAFEGKYLVYTKILETPFQIAIKITRENDVYISKTELFQFYYWPFSSYIKNMDLFLCFEEGHTRVMDQCERFPILLEYTLANDYGTYVPSWKKEFVLPSQLQLLKNKTFFYLSWRATVIPNLDFLGAFSRVAQENIYPLNGKFLEELQFRRNSKK